MIKIRVIKVMIYSFFITVFSYAIANEFLDDDSYYEESSESHYEEMPLGKDLGCQNLIRSYNDDTFIESVVKVKEYYKGQVSCHLPSQNNGGAIKFSNGARFLLLKK